MIRFLIALVIIFILKFLFDTFMQSNDIKKQGGVRKKYSVLIDYILSGHKDARVVKESNTYIAVGVSGIAGSTIFHIQQTYGNVTIQFEVKNNPIFGHIKKEWTFPENMDQELMIQRMNEDIGEAIQSLISE